jgi:hypothetical protein
MGIYYWSFLLHWGPWNFPSLIDTPLDCTKHPRKTRPLAIPPLAVRAAGWPESGETSGAPGRGRGRARPRAHLGSSGGRSRGGGVAGMGTRRGRMAAAAVGSVAGEGGFRVAHKQMLRLTCELEEALGVSAGDETLGENRSSLKRQSWRWQWHWWCARGWDAALNRGTQPAMTTAWPQRCGRGPAASTGVHTAKRRRRTGGPWLTPDRYGADKRRRATHEDSKKPRGVGEWGRHGLGRRAASAGVASGADAEGALARGHCIAARRRGARRRPTRNCVADPLFEHA